VTDRFKIGDLDVLVVSDGTLLVPPHVYYRGTSAEDWQRHKRWLNHEGNLEFPMACFLISSGDRRVLIDTGLGAQKLWQYQGGALLTELAAADVRPEQIDTVFVTHLHVDHCGTCVIGGEGEQDGAPRPAFPNATYRWTAAEHAHWRQTDEHPGSSFSIRKLLEALQDRYEPADGGSTIAPGISVIDTPGHTPGHAGVILSSGSERAFILGDAISCPAQLEEPEWSGLGDMDPKLARRTQEAVAREIESTSALLATAHFPGLTFGRVLTGEGRRYWQPIA
jgi:glyoxylase-like metal-dependent hydrolase (beta-lactamase superfamily II)